MDNTAQHSTAQYNTTQKTVSYNSLDATPHYILQYCIVRLLLGMGCVVCRAFLPRCMRAHASWKFGVRIETLSRTVFIVTTRVALNWLDFLLHLETHFLKKLNCLRWACMLSLLQNDKDNVFLSVGLIFRLFVSNVGEKGWIHFHKTFTIGRAWLKEQSGTFGGWSGPQPGARVNKKFYCQNTR